MRRVLKGIAAATLLSGGLLMTGCCGPMMCGSCNSGCGEIYIDPWINEPAGCDPCDSCGNYNGQSCGSCRPVLSGLATLWGYRYDAHCDGGGGCDSIGGGFEPACGIEAPCGACDSCQGGFEPACGIETPCGGCDSCHGGFEPACGIEAPCGGCDSCQGSPSHYVHSAPIHGPSVVEHDELEPSRVVTPPPRRVSRGGTATPHNPKPRR